MIGNIFYLNISCLEEDLLWKVKAKTLIRKSSLWHRIE
jgi:hypothetical protein